MSWNGYFSEETFARERGLKKSLSRIACPQRLLGRRSCNGNHQGSCLNDLPVNPSECALWKQGGEVVLLTFHSYKERLEVELPRLMAHLSEEGLECQVFPPGEGWYSENAQRVEVRAVSNRPEAGRARRPGFQR